MRRSHSNEEEEFIHFRSCIERLNSARNILLLIQEHNDHPLVGPAFQFALIEYCKPYLNSYGINVDSKGKPKTIKLDGSLVPKQYEELHCRIIAARNTINAHDDLTVKEPQLHVVPLEKERFVGILQNNISGTESFTNIADIISMIEMTLTAMYLEEARLEKLLPESE